MRRADDNIVEVYKGYDIVKHSDDCFEVVSDDSRFIVGLDDSKSSGSRKSIPVTVQDARNYIDWKTRP